jgi:hypothetical protein
MSYLDGLDIPLRCFSCGYRDTVSVSRLKAETNLSCPRCKEPFHVKRDDFLDEVERIEKDIAGLEAILLRRPGKTNAPEPASQNRNRAKNKNN